jgi:hypothetical protein
MSFNLIRNSRVLFTTNVDPNTGEVLTSGFTTNNTREIQVLDGMSFSQNTTAETVTLSEGGATPVRGQRSFNTALEAVDFSFSTYMRPTVDGNENVIAEEGVLWNALMGTAAIGEAVAAWNSNSAVATLVATSSNTHQLQKFGLIIALDAVSYIIDNCALESATVDFGLDAIASIAWAGKGAILRQVAVTLGSSGQAGAIGLTGGLTGSAAVKNADASYIANKLSTITVVNAAGKSYNVAITGGNLTIANNITYLTPANLGIVNKPVTYFTGTRAVSGSINAYLRAGANNTAGLMADMLAGSTTDVDPQFAVELNIGGNNPIRVAIDLPAVVLTIPSVNTEQVVSTTINFTAQGSNNSNAFDIAEANEVEIKYYAV